MMPAGGTQPDPNAPVWKVTRISDTTIFDRTSGTVAGKRIDYMLFNGQRGFITVSLDEYTPDIVAQKLDEITANDIEVGSLEGKPLSSYLNPIPTFETPAG